jgi:hypothetical protein
MPDLTKVNEFYQDLSEAIECVYNSASKLIIEDEKCNMYEALEIYSDERDELTLKIRRIN